LQIATDSQQTCAYEVGGQLYCWGNNQYSKLGFGDTLPRNTPTLVSTMPSTLAAGMGREHTCAIDLQGKAHCVGLNDTEQLGNGNAINQNAFVSVIGPATDYSQVVGSAAGTCAVRKNGEVRCWGNYLAGRASTPVVMPGLGTVRDICGGSLFFCAALESGEVKCWGDNSVGQLGNGGTPTFSSVPVLSNGITNATQVECGDGFACALLQDNTVKCWGENVFSQLGQGSGNTTPRTTPVVVPSVTGAVEIATGGYHACARLVNGDVRCWGLNDLGQLGLGDTSTHGTATTVSALAGVQQIRAGLKHTCTINTASEVWCWGQNDLGELGDKTFTHRASPVRITLP